MASIVLRMSSTMKQSPHPPVSEAPPAELVQRGIVDIPNRARSIIIFADSHGRGHVNPRNRFVSQSLVQANLGVIMPDLTVPDQEACDAKSQSGQHYVMRVAAKLITLIDWLVMHPRGRGRCLGLYGVATGAAAVMIAAAMRPQQIRSVISLSGKLDLCGNILGEVTTPSLLIVGAKDHCHIDCNRMACQKMIRKPMLEIVQGANRLFLAPGKIDLVANMSRLWFAHHLDVA